mmetsp:Transcript_48541/g.136395  ORF Transcript_48541/g.136395 Transcript_48541/m.136395 type:complete len:505 (-) Transcript_48541:2444-3958(-)
MSGMLAAMQRGDGLTAQEAACQWLGENEATWQAWLSLAATKGHARKFNEVDSTTLILFTLLFGITLLYVLEPILWGVEWANWTGMVMSKLIGGMKYCCRKREVAAVDVIHNVTRAVKVVDDRPPLDPYGGHRSTSQGPFGGNGVRFLTSRFYAMEGKSHAEIFLSRSGDLDSFVSVTVATQNMSATAGIHYRHTNETVDFRPGEQLTVLRVPLMNDENWNPARVFGVKIVEVSSTIASRPTFCQVSILNDDKYPGTVRTFQSAEKGSWAEAYTDTMAPIIEFVKWQWSARPEEHCLWLLNKFAKGCINCMIMPQLFIGFIDAIMLFDVIAGFKVAVTRVFFVMLLQFLSYCYSSIWSIRDETIINLARQMLEVRFEAHHDDKLAHELTKLMEDSDRMLNLTYGDMLGLIDSFMTLGFTIAFIVLPRPFGVYDSSATSDSALEPWEVSTYPLVIMFVLLGLVYAGVGSVSNLVEEFVDAAHERGSAWAQLLGQRMLTATLQNEAT